MRKILKQARALLPKQGEPTSDHRDVPTNAALDWTGPENARPICSGETRNAAKPAVMMLMLEMPPADQGAAVQAAVSGAARANAVAVIITDQLDFANLRSLRTPFEYLPSIDRIACNVPEYLAQRYRMQRLIILLRKWRPLRTMACNSISQSMINHLRAQDLPDDDMLNILGGPLVSSQISHNA